MIYNPQVWPLMVSAGLLVWMAIYTLRYKHIPGARAFSVLMMFCAAWAVFYILLVSTNDFEQKVFWQQMQMIPAIFVAPSIFALALAFLGLNRRLTNRNRALLLVIPALSLLGLLTSEFHTLFRYDFRPNPAGVFMPLVTAKGPLFWTFWAYSVLLNVVSLGLVLKSWFDRATRNPQALLIAAGLLIPLVSSAFSMLDVTLTGYDFTPVALLISGLIFWWGLFNYNLFDVPTVAQKMVVDAIDDPMVILDTRNLVIDYNPAAQHYLQLSSRQQAGEKANTLHSVWRKLFTQYQDIPACRDEVTVDNGEARLTFDLTISTIRDRRGRSQGRLFLLRNITERKRQEEELYRSRNMLQLVLDNIPQRVFWKDRDMRYLGSNRLFANDFGLEDPRLLVGKRDEELPCAEQALLYPNDDTQVIESGKAKINVEQQGIHANGTPHWSRASKIPLRSKDGRVFGVLGLLDDITEARRKEEALIEHLKTRYGSLFDGAPVMYVTTENQNNQPVICEANALFLTSLGYAHEEVIGHPLAEFYSPESREALLAGGYLQALTNKFTTSERQLVKRDGTVIWTLANAISDMDESGAVTGTRAMYVDITERKAAEKALGRAVYQRQRLLDLSLNMMVTRQIDDALPNIFSTLQELVTLTIGYLAWVDQSTKTLRPAHTFGNDRLMRWIKERRFPIGQGGIMNLVLETGRAELVNNAQDDPRVVHPEGLRAQQEHVIIVPLRIAEKIEGIISIIRLSPDPFQQDEFELVQLFVAQAGIVLQNARLYSEVEAQIVQIEHQRNDLRAVSSRNQSLQEKERRHIAAELHDRVGQNLTALGVNLNILQALVAAQQYGQIEQRLDDSQALLTSTTKLVRDVMSELRPSVLDDFGLVAALHEFGKSIERRCGVPVRIQGSEPEPRLTSDQETALFRIAQESVNNIIKHANANIVNIILDHRPDRIEMTIVDDGIGFSPSRVYQANKTPHWGLLTIKERAYAIGGDVEIQSSPGNGTRVRVWVNRKS